MFEFLPEATSHEILKYIAIIIATIIFIRLIKIDGTTVIALAMGIILVIIYCKYVEVKNDKAIRKYNDYIQKLDIKRLPYLQTDSRLIQIYSNLLEFSRANSRSFKRSLHYINKFLKIKHILYYENSHIAHRISNAIMYSKKALNELVAIYTGLPENSFYSNKLKEATNVIHNILNSHIEDMKKYSKKFWKDKPLNTEYSDLQEFYGPHPNDTETEYYSQNFSLY